MLPEFKEELLWLENKIDFLKRSNKNGVNSLEIKMLTRIKEKYSENSSFNAQAVERGFLKF